MKFFIFFFFFLSVLSLPSSDDWEVVDEKVALDSWEVVEMPIELPLEASILRTFKTRWLEPIELYLQARLDFIAENDNQQQVFAFLVDDSFLSQVYFGHARAATRAVVKQMLMASLEIVRQLHFWRLLGVRCRNASGAQFVALLQTEADNVLSELKRCNSVGKISTVNKHKVDELIGSICSPRLEAEWRRQLELLLEVMKEFRVKKIESNDVHVRLLWESYMEAIQNVDYSKVETAQKGNWAASKSVKSATKILKSSVVGLVKIYSDAGIVAERETQFSFKIISFSAALSMASRVDSLAKYLNMQVDLTLSKQFLLCGVVCILVDKSDYQNVMDEYLLRRILMNYYDLT